MVSLNCVLKMAYKVIFFCYIYIFTILKCKAEMVGIETLEYSDIKKEKNLIIHNLLQ